jgi:hypothetical protein
VIGKRRGAALASALVAGLVLASLGPGASPTAGAPTARLGSTTAPDGLAFSFHATPYPLLTPPPSFWPYATSTVLPLVDTGPHDATGVRMARIDGVLHDHPVDQAQYAIGLLASYDLTGNPAYLERAERQAQRLIDRAVTSRGAIYFPYGFDFARHGNGADTMRAPWYSALAQSQALTVFVRLFERTADEAYRAAATATFASFLNLPATGEPWTVDVDASGYLWLEMYPAAVPDRTYNGLAFGVYGLWDYWRLTADPDALALMRGTLTTVAHYFPAIRVTGWVSRYCLAHGVQSGAYHQVHLEQQLALFALTGDSAFARNADVLVADYPYPQLSGTLRFAGGSHTGYRFTSAGAVSATRTATLGSASSAPFNLRVRIKNRPGYWYQVTAGIWKGYLVPESPGRSFMPGFQRGGLDYPYPRTVTFSAGSHTGYRYTLGGAVTGSRSATLSRPSTAATDQRVVINGVVHLRITNGIWAGMYVPVSARVST